MLTLNTCTRNNLCIDCTNTKCLGHGKIESDCPKYHCDNPKGHNCEDCNFIKEYQKDMREYYKNME